MISGIGAQFIASSLNHIGLKIFLLYCILNAIGTIYLCLIGFGSDAASARLAKRTWLDAAAGVFFFGLAVRLWVAPAPVRGCSVTDGCPGAVSKIHRLPPLVVHASG